MGKIIAAILAATAAFAIWWLLFDSRAPQQASTDFDIAKWRALIADDGELPAEIRVEIISKDEAPMLAAETGGGFKPFHVYNTALKIASPSMTTVIGGAVDDLTAAENSRSKDAVFFPDAYARLQESYQGADQILITHEHFDHVMAITRHPAPETFAAKLKLTAEQIDALPAFGPEGGLSPILRDLPPADFSKPMRIAPGIVIAPAPGHTPGSHVFYIRRADGAEYVLVGDIVWAVSNIAHLKTRPRLLQFLFFKPPEDRAAVLDQVRALHDLAAREPGLIFISEHDGDNVEKLIDNGSLVLGFE